MELPENCIEQKYKWLKEIVEKGFVGEYASHLLDAEDNVHVFYFDDVKGDLKHAVNGPAGWSIERVDGEGTVGQFLAITRDAVGKIYVCYRDQGNDRLKMACFDGNQWNIEVVDNEPFASFDTSIAVDSSGKVYISYYNLEKGYLKVACKDKEQWTVEIVDHGQKQSNAVGSFSSCKVDARGRLHISYVDSMNGLLKYAVNDNGVWQVEVVDDSEFVGAFTSLALDREGNPYISYTVDDRPNKPDLWFAKKAAGQWLTELVDSAEIAGNYNSITVDQQSNLYISYSAMQALKLATNRDGVWRFEVVESKGTVTYTSISLDSHGMPHITYCDKDRGVKYVHKVEDI